DAGTSATGTAKVTIPVDNQSVVVEVTYSGLSGPATAGHIHSGTPAAAGPVVLPFSAPLDSPISKTLTAADYVPGTGTPPDFASFVTALKGGGAGYVNVHTNACKAGEIRAEVQCPGAGRSPAGDQRHGHAGQGETDALPATDPLRE